MRSVVPQTRNPKTNPNLPFPCMFYVCSRQHHKKRKKLNTSTTYTFFFTPFFFPWVARYGLIQRTLVLLVHSGAGSTPCWPDSLGDAAGKFFKVRFGSGPEKWVVPTLVSDVHRRMKTICGDWYGAFEDVGGACAYCGNWALVLLPYTLWR